MPRNTLRSSFYQCRVRHCQKALSVRIAQRNAAFFFKYKCHNAPSVRITERNAFVLFARCAVLRFNFFYSHTKPWFTARDMCLKVKRKWKDIKNRVKSYSSGLYFFRYTLVKLSQIFSIAATWEVTFINLCSKWIIIFPKPFS